MIERHQDYILVIPSIPAGAAALGIPLQLDTDAPFNLRARGLRVTPDTTFRSQTQVQSLRFRYANQAGDFLAQQAIQTPQDYNFAFGQGGNYKPVYPQVPYPPGGIILVDVWNDSATEVVNLQVIFRGVKTFQDGAISNRTYPSRIRALSFDYQTGKGTPTDGPLVLATTSALRQIPLLIKDDADFVLRGGQAGLWTSSGASGTYSPFGYTNLFVQLFDSQLKPYSNIPIAIDWLFGNAGGSDLSGFTALGNAAPGLFVPEIYLPKNSVMYFDLIRDDAAYVAVTDALPVRISMAWIGSKVYS